tara:strand:- start:730 stop:1002 length:273 start_codon:yes stop_codon:yes gene_type:complete
MTLKAVPIQSKMTKPTLSEVVSRLENLFNNYTIRGEDKLNVVLTSLSYCIWNLQKLVDDDDDKMLTLVDEILNQYVDLAETIVEFKPDND